MIVHHEDTKSAKKSKVKSFYITYCIITLERRNGENKKTFVLFVVSFYVL